MLENKIKRISKNKKPLFSVVNSVVSARMLQPLRKCGIPTITLIHEFNAYIRPQAILNDVAQYSSYLVFSSRLTRDDIVSNNPQIGYSRMKIIPQGKCDEEMVRIGQQDYNQESCNKNQLSSFIRTLDKDTTLILGAGQIQPRKGVDIFIAVAKQITHSIENKKVQFVWIGSGYDPNNDFNVSLWLKDQISRSELTDKLRIFDESSEYQSLMERSDIFLMTSRLDPLPNVAIDALYKGKPVHCFKDACGIADLLETEKLLESNLVAGYLNIHEMASQVSSLISHKSTYNQVSKLCQTRSREWFNMEKYIQEINSIGIHASKIEKVIEDNHKYLLQNRVKIRGFRNQKGFFDRKAAIKNYLMSWQNEVWPKKPEPGFHPGVYRDTMMDSGNLEDPYVNYLKNNRPRGIWNSELIKIFENKIQIMRDIKSDVALHIHVYYPELLDDILMKLSHNKTKPHIYITCPGNISQEKLVVSVEKSGQTLKDIITVPNLGRDIGPLIIELGKQLDSNYNIYGHLHTKKSVSLDPKSSKRWREYLLRNLLGTEQLSMADLIIDDLTRNKNIGLVFPDDPTCVGWGGNYEYAINISKQLEIDKLPRSFNFPVGTMFWAKSGALTSLYELKIGWKDLPREPLEYDGTILHAIERLITIVAQKNGYKYKMTYVSDFDRS